MKHMNYLDGESFSAPLASDGKTPQGILSAFISRQRSLERQDSLTSNRLNGAGGRTSEEKRAAENPFLGQVV